MKLSDLHFAIGTFGAVVAVGVLYVVRSARRGHAHHARTEADGGSVLLGKSVMDAGYWLLDPLVRGLAAWRITPAAVTLFSLAPACAAAVAAALGWFALAALLGTVAAFCDLVDGLLARRLGVASSAGEALDAAVDRYTEFLLLAGICVHYRTAASGLLLALAALFGSFMVSYTSAKAEAMKVSLPRGTMRRPERAVYLLVGAALTAITKALAGPSSPLILRELPILLALLLVAAISNVSTAARLRTLMVTLRARAAVLAHDGLNDAVGAPSRSPAGLR